MIRMKTMEERPPSPPGRGRNVRAFLEAMARSCQRPVKVLRKAAHWSPSPGGEGRGEGGCSSTFHASAGS